jgi:O-acetyl-ADP-ribose deacetylase (regulator of RNase III)
VISLTRGNLIEANVEALVNTVNCEGFMGKGIALQFKQAFPENYEFYRRACRAGEVTPGRMLVFETGSLVNPKYIINFPTKRTWRARSRLEDIAAGLRALVEELRRLRIRDVAVPPLGCGLGGLDWKQVRPLIEDSLSQLPELHVQLFEPAGAPAAADMPVRTPRPELTRARALFLRLMRQYAEMAYRLTLLEMQKMAYLLQEAGEPLKLRYTAHLYGPYAHNLNKVLERLEGHYIRGYGDQANPESEIELLPGSVEEADRYLAKHPDAAQRLDRVASLIEGFETPYGMELLASVHWAALHAERPARDAEEAIEALQNWNERKRALFRADHIRMAWERLQKMSWIPADGEARQS